DGSVYAQGFSTGGGHYLFVYKNGVALESTLVTSPYTNDGLQIGVDDTANGTDYYELWLKLYGGGFVNADVYAFFDGHVVGGPKGDAGVAGGRGRGGPRA